MAGLRSSFLLLTLLSVMTGVWATEPRNGWYASFRSHLAISPDGRSVVVAAFDERGAAVWDIATGALVAALPGEGVTSVAFSPDGNWVASGRMGDLVTVWGARSGKVHRKMTTGRKAESYQQPGGRKAHLGGLSVCFSADERYLYTMAGGYSGPGTVQDENFRVWDIQSGGQARSRPACKVLFSWDGKYIALGGKEERSGRATVLDPSGAELFSVEGADPLGFPDGETLLLKKGGKIASLHVPSRAEKPILKATGSFRQVTRAGLLVTDEALYDLTGNLRGELTASRPVSLVASSPNGRWLLTTNFEEAVLWDTARVRPRHRYQRGIADADFTPDGNSLISTGYDGRVRVLDLSTLKERSWLNQP